MSRSFCCASGSELAVGELQHELLAFLLRAQGVHGVAIRLFHLLVVDVADLFLRFGGLFHRGIEQDEVLVLGFGLRQAVAPPSRNQLSAMASLALARYSLVS